MKIVILSDAIDKQNAGVHHYLKSLINKLLKTDKGNEYHFIHCEKNSFFNKTNNHIIRQKKGFGKESYRRFIKIPDLIKELKPDIVLEPCHIGLFNMPKNIKKVVTIHDLTPIIFPEFHIKRSTIVHKLLLGKTLKNADLILTPSNTTKNDLIKLYKPKAPIVVTPLGINHTSTQMPPPTKSPYILYLGTIEPRKNLEILIDAFLELKKNNQIPHKLIIAGGKGWKYKKILKKTSHPEIIMPGYISDKEKTQYYKHADMFVYPSIYEGFGLPPLEAMSQKTPVICSNGGSLKEIFEKNSLMFDPQNKDQLKAHILSLYRSPDLKKKLGEKGYEYSKNFTWEKTAQKTLKAFEQICSKV